MRNIKYLVVHCTATPQTASVDSMKAYWKNKMGWKNPGYHYMVKADGTVVSILHESGIANGVAGFNSASIHIAYIGGIDHAGKATDNRTPEQKTALAGVLGELKKRYPAAKILGHRDFSPDRNKNGKIDPWEYIKQCPCFDAIPEYSKI